MNRVLILFLLLLFCCQAYADRGIHISEKYSEQRLALVIGNANYKVGMLRNPVNDSNDIARVLRFNGFQVELLTNADQRQMEKAINRFGKKLRHGGVGVFYFAGHGMQVNGVNYLIPVGANIEEEDEIRYESVNANRVLSKMQSAGNRINIVLLDACRNNPFARSFRSASRGLATMDAPIGTLIAYATAPGKTAADGIGRNGLFTGYLIKYIQKPQLPLTKLMMEVRKEVISASNGKQIPWEVSSLTGEFFFYGGAVREDKNLNSKPIEPPPISDKLPKWVIRIRDYPIVPEVGLAGLTIGDSVSEISYQLGKPNDKFPVKNSKGDIFYYAYTYSFNGMFLGIYSDKNNRLIQSFRLYDKDFNKKGYIPNYQGVSIGSSLNQILSYLGEPLSKYSHQSCPQPNNEAISYNYKGISLCYCEKTNKVYWIDIPR